MAEARKLNTAKAEDETVDRWSLERALAASALRSAASTADLRRLTDEPGLLVIVAVPSTAWLAPMTRHLVVDFPPIDEAHHARRSSRGRPTTLDVPEITHDLSGGARSIAIVSTDPQALISAELLAAADLTIEIGRPTATIVRRAAYRATGQRLRALRDADIDGLDLDDIVAAIRKGATSTASLHRLRRAKMRRASPSETSGALRLDDLAGLGEAGEWARRTVDDLVAVKSGDLDRKLQSALLYGPPGCGKSELMRAIAKSAGVRLVSTSVADWLGHKDGALGDVVQAATSVFQEALVKAPCVLAIDELDAVPDRARLSSRGRDWWTPLVTALLTEIDKIRRTRPPILLIGATNQVDRLDPALLRPGRFDRKIAMGPPDEAGLREILRTMLGAALDRKSIARIAALGRGATGATARSWVDAAVAKARAAGRGIHVDDLLAEVAPPETRSREEVRAVAIHETGHAVVAAALGLAVSRISTIDAGDTEGATWVETRSRFPTAAEIDTTLTTMFGGRVADEILGKGANVGAAVDLERATTLAAAARLAFGLRDDLLHRGDPKELRRALAEDPKLAAAVEADLKRCLERASTIVRKHQETVEEIVGRLIQRRLLDGPELGALLAEITTAGRSLPHVRK